MKSKIRLALVYKDFASWCQGASCVGLNVAGHATAQVLREYGVDTVVFPVRHNVDLVQAIEKYKKEHKKALTHVVISAPWLSPYDLKSLIKAYPHMKFVVLSHSNVGFLQADPWGVESFRAYQKLAEHHKNLKIGGNSEKFVAWMEIAYGKDVVLLPNLYPVREVCEKVWGGDYLKIGAFGAIRPEKNFMTAAAAAVAIYQLLKVPVEFHMVTGGENAQNRTLAAIKQMTADLPDFTLIEHPWKFWNSFIELVGEMDLLLQPSYTESFNMVTADGILMGVPSVVTDAIYWAPDEWKAEPDDALEVAVTGIELLKNPDNKGLKALIKHDEYAIRKWFKYLDIKL